MSQHRARPVASSIPPSPFATIEKRVEHSTEIWARDLTALFGHAKERFGDVSWETESGGDRIWGHKAVIYARAPKAFKDRYFLTRPFSRSPTLRSPSPSSSHLLPPLFSSRPNSPPSSFHAPSSLSARTTNSDVTVRGVSSSGIGSDGIMRLTHGDTPELFQAQLEWLYTGEGFGDVVEWISEEDVVPIGASIRDSLGRRGNQEERRDKLGQDLTYMWRSKLYVDVRIHLDSLSSSEDSIGTNSDSDDSTDSLSSTAVFTAHRFILVSRSPYFAALLLNTSSFLSPTLSGGTVDINLSTPPFTPASLHFCLGYIYAGHLDFSNRTFDLTTAFQIYRAAAYLQLDSLIDEVTARIVWDFCHGLDHARCHCKRCSVRVARVWRFALEDDVGNVDLARAARSFLITGWGGSWSREVGLSTPEQQIDLVKAVQANIDAQNIISTFRSIGQVRIRTENAIRTKGNIAAAWVDGLGGMIDSIEEIAREVLVDDFGKIAEGIELWELLDGKGFSADLVEAVMKELVDHLGSAKKCVEAPRVYQALVSSILLRTHPETLQTALPIRSRGRQIVESAKDGVLGHIKRRWLQIKATGGFNGLEMWAMKEIADAIEVSDEDLISISTSPTPRRTTPQTTRAGIPRTISKVISLSDTASGRSSIASSSRIPLSPIRQETSPPSTGPTEPNGLRRLRLSSAASTSSAMSTRSTRPRETSPFITSPPSMIGPGARSPTAAKIGGRVSIGAGGRRVVSGSIAENGDEGRISPTPSSKRKGIKRETMSGGIRPLVSRGSLAGGSGSQGVSMGNGALGKSGKGKEKEKVGDVGDNGHMADPGPSRARTPASSSRNVSPEPTPSLNSVRTGRSTKSTTTSKITGTTTPKTTTPAGIGVKSSGSSTTKPPIPSTAPARTRTPSVVSTTRTPRPSAVKNATPPIPPVPSRPTNTSQTKPVRTPVLKTTTLRSAGSTGSVASAARSRLESAASVTSTRVRTSSVATTASVSNRTRTPSSASTLRNPPPLPTSTPPIPTKSRTPISSPRASGLSTHQSRLGPKIAPRAPFPLSSTTTSPNAAPGLQVPTNRSSSSSTAEDPEARTPRSSETGDPIIRLPSGDSDNGLSPIAPRSTTLSSPRKLPPPVAIPRNTRKASSASTRSASGQGHPASAFDPPRRPITPPPLADVVITDGSRPFGGKGVSLRVGIPCIVSLEGRRARFRAQVKYIGYLNNSKGPWVGIEVEDLDRFGVNTFPAGSQDGIHYFHLTSSSSTTSSDSTLRVSESEYDQRLARQRKIELIREGLKKSNTGYTPKSNGVGLGMMPMINGLGLGLASSIGGERGSGRGTTRRSISPFVGPGGVGPGGGNGVDWVGTEGLRALFVRPSEVVYVVGAE